MNQPDHKAERLIFFSDAVFAIAITLLVIEIEVPTLGTAHGSGWHAMRELLPSFAGFAISFLVIGRFWMGHHAALAQLSVFSPRLLWPNLFLLMAIAFMPFATAFLSRNFGEIFPTAFYNATLLVTALLSWNLIRVVGSIQTARDAEMGRSSLSVAVAATLAFGLSFVAPAFSQLGLLAIPLIGRLQRWRQTV